MSLTILSVAYPFAPVSLDAAGGAEQILAIIDEQLILRGDRSIVLGREGSRVRGELVPVGYDTSRLDAAYRSQVQTRYRELLESAISDHAPQIVHMHGVDALHYLPNAGPPVLMTLHLPRSFYPDNAFDELERPSLFFNCVSESQQRAFPDVPGILGCVANGIRVEDYELGEHGGAFVLALGRICPEKGYHLALDAARLADIEMLLAGQLYPYEEHELYFRQEIVPRLDGPRRFIGPVELAQKRRLLASARCLLVPSTAPETSSLVAMEALASGTPVIAHRIGALPDIVKDEETGFLVESVEEMAEAIGRIGDIDRARCREVAMARFSASPMVSKYIELYEYILGIEGRG